MYKKWNLLIILVLLLGLVIPKPAESVFAEDLASADFVFTSTPNPSNLGQEVVFSVSATGSDPVYPPFGYVDFKDNGNIIPSCESVPLNYPNSTPAAGNPAICSTTSLSVGTHTITAEFNSILSFVYPHSTLTLLNGQSVNDSIPLSITPTSLEDAMITTPYQMQLIATYPDGSVCANCSWWYHLGELPDGIGLFSETGVIQGTPTSVGTSNFTVHVDDLNGARGSQEFSLQVTEVRTIVDVDPVTTFVGNLSPITLSATARHPDPAYSPRPTGKISFSVSDIPVPGCSGENAKSTNSWGYAECYGYFPSGLTAGSYTIQAEFTPDTTSADLYQVGIGNGTLQINSQQPAQVSGLVFMDDNQNGVRDDLEFAQGNWNVYLNQDCDDFLEGNVVTNPFTGEFSFEPVPLDYTYCLFVDLAGYNGYVQTTPFNNLTLSSGNQYFEIGIYYPHISIQPGSEEDFFGKTGTFFEQAFQISGGTQPYSIETISEGLSELIFDEESLTLFGTPTVGGFGQFHLKVVDAEGISAEMTYSIMIQSVGEFLLESSANPSTSGQAVTFTMKGSGSAIDPQFGTVPPYGIVSFYDGDILIPGCEEIVLNFNQELFEIGDYPASCTTSDLSEGEHTIHAYFTYPAGLYADAMQTLTQQVGIVEPLTIMPETIPDAIYGMPFSQWFSGICAEGFSCGFINWRLTSGSLPTGIQLQPHGLLSGSPSVTGSFTFTIEGFDVNNYDIPLGTRTYTLNVLKVTPKVTFDQLATYFDYNTYTYKTYFHIYITHPNGSWTVNPAGSVSVSVDGSPVDVCTNLGPIPNMAYLYSCVTTDELVGLMPGIHTLHVDFTPDANTAPNFNSASGDTNFTNPPRIEGLQFNDLDRDGVRDDGEQPGYYGYIDLDRDCDGTNDVGTPADNSGQFSLNITPGEYCMNVTAYGDWFQTTILEPFTVDEETYKYFEIGFFESQLTYDPMELPGATVGKLYSQAVLINGGVAPYALISVYQDLPGGFKFDISMNESSITFSGAPTTAGEGYISLEVQDSTGMKGNWNSSIVIKADGLFTLTSSSNPAIQGEEVTFTLSATGDVVYYDNPYLPMGTVTFYADGNPIEGCTEIFLNVDLDWNMGEFPAICKTTALETGSHQVTATFQDWTGFYNDAMMSLTQVINTPVFADLSIDKTDSKDPVKPGTKFTYSLLVTNLGKNTAENVIVTDKLDVTTTYLSISSPRGWACKYVKLSGTVTCTINSMKSNSTALIKITVMVIKAAKVGKELVNNAFVSSSTFDPNLSNNAVVQKTMVVK